MMHGLKGLSACALALGCAAPLCAQTAPSTGTTTIVDEYSLTKDTDLAFGAILPPTTGTNTVVIDAATGDRSLTGAGNAAEIGSATSRATYTVDGDGGQTFAINIPSTFLITRQSGGSETIEVTLVPTALGGTLSNSTGTAGTATFGVGGTFPVSNSTPIGHYIGTFVITVENN